MKIQRDSGVNRSISKKRTLSIYAWLIRVVPPKSFGPLCGLEGLFYLLGKFFGIAYKIKKHSVQGAHSRAWYYDGFATALGARVSLAKLFLI